MERHANQTSSCLGKKHQWVYPCRGTLYLPPSAYDFEHRGDRELGGGRKGASLPRAHEAAEGKRPQKRKTLSLSPCLSLTHTCVHTHTHQFGAKCPQLLLWTPEILLLGLQELTEGKRTPEEKGSCHLRSRIQVFGGLLETGEDAGSSKLKLWVKAS